VGAKGDPGLAQATRGVVRVSFAAHGANNAQYLTVSIYAPRGEATEPKYLTVNINVAQLNILPPPTGEPAAE